MGRISSIQQNTVLEVVELSFETVKFSQHHHLPHKNDDIKQPSELEGLRMENERLRELLQEKVKLLQNISVSPYLLQGCPPDLHTRIMDTVESPKFLNQLKTLHKDSVDGIPGTGGGCHWQLYGKMCSRIQKLRYGEGDRVSNGTSSGLLVKEWSDGPLMHYLELEVVEKLLKEEMLMGSSNHLGALRALGDEFGSLGDGVFVSSWVKSTNNCFGGMTLIFGLLETLEVEALVEAINVYGC
ncbi:hypothetical protein Tco_0031774 [Tanacetum coccineum]